MKKLINAAFVVGFGWLGWVLGAKVGFMTAYFASGFAGMFGLYLGWKLVRRMTE